MNEEETQVKNTADTQPTETEDKQSKPTENKTTPVGDTPVTAPDATPQDKPAETKPADTQATAPAPEQPKKLADVVPTTLVWISGMVGNHQIDCAGPIELPFELTKPEWPYTTVAPNPAYTNQVFDYDAGAWVATDAKSQGQQITDLGKKVEALQEDSANHEKSADQTQQMGMQLTKTMALLATKFSTMEGKLDTLLNAKDGDK